jgi:hypothetical protein
LEIAPGGFRSNHRWPLLLQHLPVEGLHRHLAHDIVGLRLIEAAYNVPLALVGQHCRGSRSTIYPIRVDSRTIQGDQGSLDFANVFTPRTLHDVPGIGSGGSFKFIVAAKRF